MSPDEVRQRLLEAVVAADGQALAALCHEHRATIEAHWLDWKVVPEGLRDDREAVERYVAGLVAVARYFAEVMGDPRLLHRLTGEPDNPLQRWHARLGEVQDMLEGRRYDEAAAICDELLEHTRAWQGSGVEQYRPVTLGLLASARFNGGKPAEAVAPYEEALHMCIEAGDLEGIAAYTNNLVEVHRWLGQADVAADHADRLADVLQSSDPAAAAEHRARAKRLRAGEPPLRVVVVVASGRKLELDELDDEPELSEGRLRFAFERDRVTLGQAAGATEEGIAAAESGDLEAAIEAFDRAIAIDPHDPEPRYQAAMACAELGHFDDAATRYAALEELAAGWYRTREDRWLVDRIREGDLPPTVLTAIRELEDGSRPPRAKIALAEATLEQHPDLARVWLALGRERASLGDRDGAEAALRRALEHAPEPAIRTRALTELGGMCPDREEGTRHLVRATDLGGDLVAAAMARVILIVSKSRAH